MDDNHTRPWKLTQQLSTPLSIYQSESLGKLLAYFLKEEAEKNFIPEGVDRVKGTKESGVPCGAGIRALGAITIAAREGRCAEPSEDCCCRRGPHDRSRGKA